MWRFSQAEGITGRLLDAKAMSPEHLDMLAIAASQTLGRKSIGYYKCDIYKDDVVVDRFDLCPSKGVGVDDMGRTPSQMLRQRGIIK